MATLFDKKSKYIFDFSMKRVRVLCSKYDRWTVMTKQDISYYAGYMFPVSTLSISPQSMDYESCKKVFMEMLQKKNYDNVSFKTKHEPSIY